MPTVPPRTYLVLYDGSAPSLRAVTMAAALARATGGSIRLLTAIERQPVHGPGRAAPSGRLARAIRTMERDLCARAERALEPARRICRTAGVDCSSRVVVGRIPQIVQQAAKRADLIVMGSRGLGTLRGLVLGSLTQRVLAGTATPVLVVH